MLSRPRRATVRRPRRTRAPAAESGFTLVEVLVSVSLLAIVMTAFTTFFVTSISTTSAQGTRQVALQVANEAMEQVRALKGTNVTAGRDLTTTTEQWADGLDIPAVAEHLVELTQAADPDAAYPSGRTARLPTEPTTVTINGTSYDRHWYIGTCWRGLDETCLAAQPLAEDPNRPATKLFRVVVAVTWAGKNCPTSKCAYTTSTLINTEPVDPLFNVSGPSGGSVEAIALTGSGGRYSTSSTLTVAMNKGTDPSGMAAAGAQLRRATATLTSVDGTADGTCGTFGSFTLISTDPVSPMTDPVPPDACYRYRYVVSGNMGAPTTYTSGDVKVDTTPPTTAAPIFSALSNATVVGSTVYFLEGASGSFTVTGSATDAQSGIASWTFPSLGAGWTATDNAPGVRTYSWTAASPTPAGAHTITARNHATLSAALPAFTVAPRDVDGPTGGSVLANGLLGTGGRYSPSTTLNLVLDKGTDPSGLAATGARLLRASAGLTSGGGTADGACGVYGGYSLYTQVGADDPGSPVPDVIADQSCYRYQYEVRDSRGNLTTYTSAEVKVDTTAPAAPALAFSNLTNAFAVGTSVSVVTGAASGAFTVTATATDAASGIASYTFPSSLGSGWTATPGGTGVMTYSWSAPNPALPAGAQNVTATNNALLTSPATGFTVVDASGPSGGSVDATGLIGTGTRYSTSTSLSLALNKGTAPNGLAPTGATLTRASATLTNGSCGTYGGYALIAGGTDPASPAADTVADQACHRYQYTVADTAGTSTTYGSPDIKIDTTAPAAPTLSFTALTNATAVGTNVYRTGGATNGSFTVTATATDPASGIANYTFPSLGAGWTAVPGAAGVMTYSWNAAGPADSAANPVTARNNAFLTSPATTFGVSQDSTTPAGGSITYVNGPTTSRAVTITLNPGTDGGSGINPAAGILRRAAAPFSGGSCGTFTAFGDLTVGPASPYVDSTVLNGMCYQYTYAVSDYAGNSVLYTSGNVAIVNYASTVGSAASLFSWWRLGETPIISSDNFTDLNGVTLGAHTSQVGTVWTRRTGDTINAVIAGNALRRGGLGTVNYYTSAAPPSADYLVEAHLVYKSALAGDFNGVVGRLDPAGTGAGTFYTAGYNAATGQWQIIRMLNGTATAVGTASAQALTVNQTYRLGLDLKGTTIRLLVDGVTRVSGTDAGIAAAGRAGVRFSNAGTTASDTTGIHIDNFEVSPPAEDSKGTNTGDYHRGVGLGAPGALPRDPNTAATFDGANDFMHTQTTTSFPVGAQSRSVELWFKTPGPAVNQERQALFSYGTYADTQQFGVWLENDGTRIKTEGGGASDRTFTFANFNDNNWHHFVLTYDGTELRMYVDGVLGSGTRTAVRNTIIDANAFSIGRVHPGRVYFMSEESYFNGAFDEVSFYNTALPAATVVDHFSFASSAAGDSAGPTGGSVDATGLLGAGGRYSGSTNLNIAFSKGTDPSGFPATGATLARATATLANNVCGTYGAYALVSGGNDPTSPKAETVADQACYRYQYVVPDALGNSTTYTSGDIKVDTTAPSAPTFAFSAMTNAYAVGNTVYYRPGATSGSFTITASATDPASGIDSYTFGSDPGGGWTRTGTGTVMTYSWSAANPSPPTFTRNVAVANLVGLSAQTAFTVATDSAGPTGGSISYPDGFTGGVTIAFAKGSDAAVGVDPAYGRIRRASSTLSGGVCGAIDPATMTDLAGAMNNPASPYVDSTVVSGNCYQYQYVVRDLVGNLSTYTSTSVAKVGSYSATVQATTGLVGYWRLGDTNISSDTFTGAANTVLSDRSPEIGTSWTRFTGDTATNVLTSAGRLRKAGTGVGSATYYTAAVPPTANYQVEADVYVASLVANDYVGIVGRMDPTNTAGIGTHYLARYEMSSGQWQLRYANASAPAGGPVCGQAMALTAGQTYHLVLDMRGSTIRLLVNGAVMCSATDTRVAAAGRAGVRMGAPSGSVGTQTDTTGLHLDNFSVNAGTTGVALDSKGTNHGSHVGGVVLGAAGALVGDPDTAATFNGVNQYTTVARQIQGNFSIEFWFKSTQGIATGANWWHGAGLVDADATGKYDDFGVGLRADGKVVAGTGSDGLDDISVMSAGSGYNDGNWHHVVFTRNQTSGAMILYVDGVSTGPVAGHPGSLTDSPSITFGRIAGGTNFFAGSLDEVAVYNTVLSAATVTTHYNLGRG